MNKEQMLTQAMLRELLNYDPLTGVFSWINSQGIAAAGAAAGNINSNGYKVVGLLNTKYRQHRLAWLYVHGVWPSGTIDHIDGNRTNNAIANLRDVSRAINSQNKRNASAISKTGVLGVYFSHRRNGYMASISWNGKKKRRGPYQSLDRAQAAYLDLKRTHHEGCTL